MIKLKDAALLRQRSFIDGEWVDADSGDTIEVHNPATSALLGSVPDMGAAEARRAIDAAHAAQPAWARKTAGERARLLRKWFELMMSNQEDLAVIMTAEQGKPLAESRGEIAYAAAFIEWFAEEARRVYGDVIPGHQPDKRILVLRQPIGVVAAITPWNFPAAMITRKAGPAIAAGCTIVVKPAQQTPFSALAMAELAYRAGIPHGVFNVITGDAKSIGGEFTGNHKVRKVSFTGSTPIGKLLMSQCSRTPTSTPRWPAPSRASTAIPDRPACAPTASSCIRRCTTRSRPNSSKRCASCASATASRARPTRGP
jgi:succinate-semialdehyde dehydrogenase/glutarate-semialdehyde dehydrogenase